jgi:hypothetical protein
MDLFVFLFFVILQLEVWSIPVNAAEVNNMPKSEICKNFHFLILDGFDA